MSHEQLGLFAPTESGLLPAESPSVETLELPKPLPQVSGHDDIKAADGVCLYLDGLNERQRDAVMTPVNQALQVLAGAGTGKTELISRRFVKLVKDLRAQGLAQPESHILVVTFTSDAAAGMKERIHQRLLQNGENGLTPTAWISTFHQFCMRLLRSHPLEVGLPPGFIMLNSLQQQVVFNRVAHGVLAGTIGELDLVPILEKYELAGVVPASILTQKALEQTGLDDLEALLEPGGLFKLISRIKSSGLSPSEFLRLSLAQSRGLTERLKTMPVPHDPELKSAENTMLKVEAWRAALMPWAHDRWDPISALELKSELTGKKLTASSYKEVLPGLVTLHLKSRTYDPVTPDLAPLEQALAQEASVIQRVAAIYALYQEALLAQGGCDFDDLINHAITLLESHPVLRARYRQCFEAIIVDEFQDSNGSQLRLLELLMRDGAQNLTVVGDEKQSIYAFRFAQPENLDLIFRHGPYKKVNLQINYRSLPPILDVANALTDRITARAEQRLMACERYLQAELVNHPTLVDHPAKVKWVSWDGFGEEESDRATEQSVAAHKAQEAEYIAVEVARLVASGQYRFSEIVVLVKSHAKAEAIQKTLAAYNIPAIRQKNLGFFQESVVKDALALLRLMRNPADDLSLVRLLQGKLNQRQIRSLMALKKTLYSDSDASNGSVRQQLSLFTVCLRLHDNPALAELPLPVAQALGDLAAQLEHFRRQKGRLAPAVLFAKLANVVGLIAPQTPAWLQKQQRVTLRTFEKLLYLFTQNQPLQPTLEEVIETLEQYAADPSLELPVSEELSGEDAVRLMTVFASKGLEFPVVFCAYIEKGRAPGAGDHTTMVFDPQYSGKNGFGLILNKPNGRPNLKRDVYSKCWATPRGELEAQRVFYVALTRARERLYVLQGQHSPGWTDPADYPGQAIDVLAQSRHAAALNSLVSGSERETVRLQMAELQERQRTEAVVAL